MNRPSDIVATTDTNALRKNVFNPTSAPSFFDADQQRAALTKCGDPLVALSALIHWEAFRSRLHMLFKKKPQEKSKGRKPIDPVLMFKVLILQRLYSLSDDQIEFHIRDRASFQRFLGIFSGHGSPDAKTVWLFRERLREDNVAGDLFLIFDDMLLKHGMVARGGQMVDASFVEVPRQRNTREENALVKIGETPPEWEEREHKFAQKDIDARWTKKHDQKFFGYKNHINADVKHKLIRSYLVTPASIHDSQALDDVLMPADEGRYIYADSAYRSTETQAHLKEKQYVSRICERAYRNTPLTKQQEQWNHSRSKIRCRVEHVFGAMFMKMHGRAHVLCIGLERVTTVIGLENLTYNMRRFIQLRVPKKPRLCGA